jgi:cytochrome c oxidase subunit 6c
LATEAGAVAKVPKPELRGYLISYIKKHMVIAFALSTVASTMFWYFVARQRKINYENFYKTYDAQKDYERMKKAGIFQSIPQDE